LAGSKYDPKAFGRSCLKMKTIKVNLNKRTYPIIIGRGIITQLGEYISSLGIGQDAYIITNSVIKKKYGNLLAKSLQNKKINFRFRLIPDTEESKSISCLASIIEDIAQFDKKRKIFVVAFGGGVVGDLAGFVASIYKRGIPYIQVPTTLLAQVDSSIGGKTAVDLTHGKNLVGAFYQPRMVFSDLAFLESLDLRQLKSGLAEVIKYALIKDKQLFNFLENNFKDVLKRKPGALEYIVWRSALIKAKIVAADEREERGLRTILNFGHTIGHAIEAAGKFKKYNHGEAIAIGMVAACSISKKLGLLSEGVSSRARNLIKAAGLPIKVKGISIDSIISATYRDKKFIGGRNRFVLIKNIASTKILQDVPIGVVREALR